MEDFLKSFKTLSGTNKSYMEGVVGVKLKREKDKMIFEWRTYDTSSLTPEEESGLRLCLKLGEADSCTNMRKVERMFESKNSICALLEDVEQIAPGDDSKEVCKSVLTAIKAHHDNGILHRNVTKESCFKRGNVFVLDVSVCPVACTPEETVSGEAGTNILYVSPSMLSGA